MEINFNWFWVFLIVFFLGDTYVHLRGRDTFFWKYETPAEIELQQKIIKSLENK